MVGNRQDPFSQGSLVLAEFPFDCIGADSDLVAAGAWDRASPETVRLTRRFCAAN